MYLITFFNWLLRLEELANWARSKMILQEVKTGIFSKKVKCFSGAKLLEVVSLRYPSADQFLKTNICQDLITHQFIHPMGNNIRFSPNPDCYFVFQCDKKTVAQNMTKIWYSDCRKALEVSCDLIKILNQIIQEIRPLSNNKIEIPEMYEEKSHEYKKFLEAICELQKVELDPKKTHQEEILAFFLNIFQVYKI